VIVLDNGPTHTSKATLAALAARAHWPTVEWLPKYAPEPNGRGSIELATSPRSVGQPENLCLAGYTDKRALPRTAAIRHRGSSAARQLVGVCGGLLAAENREAGHSFQGILAAARLAISWTRLVASS
jgi:hypothetical protein